MNYTEMEAKVRNLALILEAARLLKIEYRSEKLPTTNRECQQTEQDMDTF